MTEMCLESPFYRDRDWLYNEYVVKKRTTPQMAIECGTVTCVITGWMDKFNIKRRTPSEATTLWRDSDDLWRDKDWLYDQYWNKKRTAKQIGIMCNIDKSAILYWMRKMGILRRNQSEAKKANEQYNDKDWLFFQYITLGKSMRQMGRECDTDNAVICRRLKRFKIPVRSRIEATKSEGLYSNREWLYHHYVELNLTSGQIANLCKASPCTIWRWLVKHNIPRRSGSEKVTLQLRERASKRMKGMMYSEECVAKRSGPNHWNWQGGISYEPYGEEFNDELKEQIRRRDNYICQECGKTQEELGQNLDVHHIDYDKTNNKFENLICLCKSCHGKTMYNRDYWIEYFRK